MEIFLAQPRGFCAGVTRAITIVERALAVYGAPVYVRHEIVHNRTVVKNLRDMGAIFVETLENVPDGSTVIYSAHGVPKSVEKYVKTRNFRIFDATCPLVTKVHREVVRMHDAGKSLIMIGHAGHPEVEGTMGQIDSGMHLVQSVDDVARLSALENVAYVSQTTISVDDAKAVVQALKNRFPSIEEPKKTDVCYATQNRQDAVKGLAQHVDLILVIGSTTSSNSNRLREVSERQGVRAYLVDSSENIDLHWFQGDERVGITAGASAPEALVQNVVTFLQKHFPVSSVSPIGALEENVTFPMPKGLWQSDLDRVNHE